MIASILVQMVAPDHITLRSWMISANKRGHFSLSHRRISPLFDSRTRQESFFVWGDLLSNYFDFLQSVWQNEVYTLVEMQVDFQSSGIYLYNGCWQLDSQPFCSYSSSEIVSIAAAAVCESHRRMETQVLNWWLFESRNRKSVIYANIPWCKRWQIQSLRHLG